MIYRLRRHFNFYLTELKTNWWTQLDHVFIFLSICDWFNSMFDFLRLIHFKLSFFFLPHWFLFTSTRSRYSLHFFISLLYLNNIYLYFHKIKNKLFACLYLVKLFLQLRGLDSRGHFLVSFKRRAPQKSRKNLQMSKVRFMDFYRILHSLKTRRKLWRFTCWQSTLLKLYLCIEFLQRNNLAKYVCRMSNTQMGISGFHTMIFVYLNRNACQRVYHQWPTALIEHNVCEPKWGHRFWIKLT